MSLILEESIDLDLKTLSALVSYTTTSGIFYIEADQDFKGNSYVVYRKIGEDHLRNGKNVVRPIRKPNMNIVCYSADRFNVRKMANVIIAHYIDLNGKLGDSTGVIVKEVVITDDSDIGRLDEKFAVNIDLLIIYQA
jgi:hypothetical protein